MKIRLLLGLVCLVTIVSMASPVVAQKQKDNFGTEFWLGYGPNEGGETYDQNGDARTNETKNVMDLYITSRVVARGSVEVPALNFFQSFTTTPGQITTIHLPDGNFGGPSVEVVDVEQVVHGMSIHVTSDSNIAVFGLNHKEYSSDAFMGLPNDVLGTEYRTMNYFTSNPGRPAPGEFWIIGTADSTNVTITLHETSSMGTAPNTPFNVRLDKGDMYLIQGADDETNDLTGSHIESDYPIAVFSGSMRCPIPEDARTTDGSVSRDHLVEELPPESAWGDSALVIPFSSSKQPDLVRAVCAEDQTEIKVNGVSKGIFNAGEFYEIKALNGVTSIQGSKPIMVGQYMHTSLTGLGNNPYGDPALALVFPVEQFTTTYTIVSIVDGSFTGNFVNIVADQTGVNSMILDGAPMNPAEFKNIPNSRFAYAQHKLQQGTHNISGGKPFGVTIYALGPVDSYAYTGGTLLKTITPLKTVGLVIDFGDRVLTPPLYPEKFDTTVYLQNISDDTVNIFSFPKRVQDTDRFYVKAGQPLLPRMIEPGKTDSMTIEFYPHEVNRRLHTQVTAKTDHLRAYVVDVYGRGVQDEMGVFSEPQKVHPIDTLDFGVFTTTDAPADSAVYIGNAGTAIMTVNSATLGGADVGDFSIAQMTYAGAAVTTPFTVAEPPSEAARIGLRFTPTGLANRTYLAQVDIASKASTHTVILRGHVHTIHPLFADTNFHAFDSTKVCSDANFNVIVKNINDVPDSITSASIGGTDAGEFALATKVPLVIAPGDQATLSIHFIPTGRGQRSANLALKFNLPKNAPVDTINLIGTGDKPTLEFAGAQNVYGYALTTFLVPIFAKTDLTPYGASSYNIHLSYDSVYLRLVDFQTLNTLTPVTPNAYPVVYPSSPYGSDTIIFSQGSENGKIPTIPITGGGSGSLPLIYLKFQAVLNGQDPQNFTRDYSIGYDVNLLDPKISSSCFDRTFEAATASVVSVCTTPIHLTMDNGAPLSMMLEQSTPDPFNSATTMGYDVSAEGPVKLEVCDATGNPVRVLVDDVKKPGYYHATLDGLGLPSGAYLIRMTAGDYRRMRRVILSK